MADKRIYDLTTATGDLTTAKIPLDRSDFTQVKNTTIPDLITYTAPDTTTNTVALVEDTDDGSYVYDDGAETYTYMSDNDYLRLQSNILLRVSSPGDHEVDVTLNISYPGYNGRRFPIMVLSNTGAFVRTVAAEIIAESPIKFRFQSGTISDNYKIAFTANLLKA